MSIKFEEELKKHQKRLGCSQKQMCGLLFDVPVRTLQSWLLGEKLPPSYYHKLVLYKLDSAPENREDSVS